MKPHALMPTRRAVIVRSRQRGGESHAIVRIVVGNDVDGILLGVKDGWMGCSVGSWEGNLAGTVVALVAASLNSVRLVANCLFPL